jgi:hypothetical protein
VGARGKPKFDLSDYPALITMQVMSSCCGVVPTNVFTSPIIRCSSCSGVPATPDCVRHVGLAICFGMLVLRFDHTIGKNHKPVAGSQSYIRSGIRRVWLNA